MKALDRKLFRDLVALKGQVVTIAVVVACGVASYVTLLSAFASIERSRAAYYEAQRFPDVFAHLERAPSGLEARVAALPGVAEAETRIVHSALIPIAGMSEPAAARVVSLPREGGPRLADVHLRQGRLPDPTHRDEIALLETFAEAHRLGPGSELSVVMGGIERRLRVVGIVVSPEYVFAVAGGTMVQDPKRFAVVWMPGRELAPAYAMDGAFNDVVLRLQPGANERAVIDALDGLLASYGGLGAYARDRQISNMMLQQELGQLESYATIAPVLFLSVAAFLVHVVIARTVNLQRTQIAVLKAVGYSNREVGVHYLEMVAVISLLGAALGVALGAYLGRGMLDMYRPYFHIPDMAYVLDARMIFTSTVISIGAAVLGTLSTVWRVARLPPAAAMTPEAPALYRRSVFELLGLGRLFGTSARMVIRELSRHPVRTVASVVGVSFAIAIMVVARFSYDGITALVDTQFRTARREDIEVTFRHVVPTSVVTEIRRLPGVFEVEPSRAVSARVRSAHRSRDALVSGRPADASLSRIVEWPLRVVPVPDRGVMLSAELASLLDVRPGDYVTLEPHEGDRRPRDVVVTGTVRDVFGLSVYATLDGVAEIFGGEPTATSVLVTFDPAYDAELMRRLERLPALASVTRRKSLIDRFDQQMSEVMYITMAVLTAFAAAIAIGVIYNNARIALSMRARDLASLRVLGYTRGEISAVLLGELAAYVVLAVAPGLVLGRAFCDAMMSTVDRELYRFPTVISAQTYAFAVVVTAATALVSALLVRRKLDQLDLIGVLKTRE